MIVSEVHIFFYLLYGTNCHCIKVTFTGNWHISKTYLALETDVCYVIPNECNDSTFPYYTHSICYIKGKIFPLFIHLSLIFFFAKKSDTTFLVQECDIHKMVSHIFHYYIIQ